MRFDMDEPRQLPPPSAWKSLPRIVRWAILFVAACVLIPPLIFGSLALIGILAHLGGWL